MSTVLPGGVPADPRSAEAASVARDAVALAGPLLAEQRFAAPPAAGSSENLPTTQPRAVPAGFGPGAAVEAVWLRAVALRPTGAVVAMSSADGGVGRSTLTAALGSVLALASPDPVIAVDMNARPWGGLADRVGRSNAGTVWDTVRDVHTLTTRQEVERWVQHGPTGLHALVGEGEMNAARRPPAHRESMTVVAALRPLYRLAMLDMSVAEIRGVWVTLAAADAPVLVARATTDSLHHTMRLLAQLRAAGLSSLAERAVIVVMTTSSSTAREVRAVAQQAAAVAGALVTVPYDPALATPEPIDARRLRRPTRRALLDVAVEVLSRCPAGSDIPPPRWPAAIAGTAVATHPAGSRGPTDVKERP